jgi:bifunctional DNA-binding transcriptional regulator/antitoxin component of YhaV-PrlF toxin-antitoxin module
MWALVLGCAQASAAVTVGNVRAAQRAGTKLVDIDYDVAERPRLCLSLMNPWPVSPLGFYQVAFGDPEWGDWGEPFDWTAAAVQYCCMTAIPVSKRGTITLPPEIRRALGLDAAEHPMMLVELRDGGVFLQPAGAMPVRDIPLETIQQWIAADERDAESFWKKAGKA